MKQGFFKTVTIVTDFMTAVTEIGNDIKLVQGSELSSGEKIQIISEAKDKAHKLETLTTIEEDPMEVGFIQLYNEFIKDWNEQLIDYQKKLDILLWDYMELDILLWEYIQYDNF